MSDEFTCPCCGVSYVREKRRIGKPVVCGCGHRVLVPPADEPPATPPADFGRAPQHTPPAAQHAEIPRAEPVDSNDAQMLPEAEIGHACLPGDALFGPMDDPFGEPGSYAAAKGRL